MPDDDFEEIKVGGDDDDWHAGAERQVMNKMEKWREKYGYKGRGDVLDDSSVMSENDILNIVEAKERDLILAAELGKALLEKNEELRNQNERIAKEFSEQLEALEQEKYQLKRQLEIAEEEYEQRIFDLQKDIADLKNVIDKHSNHQKQLERHSSQLVSDLTEQNQRLASQLRSSGENEKELRNQMNRIKQQFNNRKTTIQEQCGHVESLRDEISAVMDKKRELENQIRSLSEEKTNLSETLEQSSENIRQMEKKQKEQHQIVRSKENDIEELRAGNQHLLERLETMSRSRSSSPSCHLSLLCEIEMSGSDHEKRTWNQRQFEIIEEADEEFNVDDLENSESDTFDDDDDDADIKGLKQEVLSAYQQLRNMSILIRQRERKLKAYPGYSMETSSSGSSVEVVNLKAGQLNQAVAELRALLHQLLRKESQHSSKYSQGCQTCGRSLQEKQNLEVELHQTLEQIERGKIGLKQSELVAKQKDEEIQRIRSKLLLLEARLNAAEEERMILKKDVEESSLSKETLIKSAWSSRDAAVARKNVAEVELARGRIEGMQVSSQLMEAVQQKVALSQQLEEWEVDLQVMLQEQVKDKLVQNTANQSVKSSSSDTERGAMTRKLSRPSSIISFFSR